MKGEDQQELKDFMTHVRSIIKQELWNKEWSLLKLADEADTDYRSLCMMMRGKHTPNVRTLVKILTALDFKLEAIYVERD